MSKRETLLVANFVLGAYAVCAQATLLRETQTIVFGSELSWGLVLAFWLAGVALGALPGPLFLERWRRPLPVFAAACLALPLVLTATVVIIRAARGLAGAGPGEYLAPGAMVAVVAATTLPVGFLVGLAFPAASALLARDDRQTVEKARAIGWIYLADSLGSLAGGVVFSFLLVGWMGALPLTVAGGVVLCLVIAHLLRRHAVPRWARLAPLLLALAGAVGLVTGLAGKADDATIRGRWQTFAQGLDLVESRDTRYQNLALGRLSNQFSVYADGIVAATWPNEQDLAIRAHLAACQAPAPKQMLVLGGGMEGILKELLRHKPQRLDYVTLDPALPAMVRDRLGEEDRQALDRLAGSTHFDDARRFIRRAAAERRTKYDLIILDTPEPASALEARMYTLECFEELLAILSDDGVLALTLTGSAGYWSPESAQYVGSIVRPLEEVFPDVMLTFGSPTHIYAARRKGVLTASGETLAARYRARGVQSPHFDPLWFEGASDLLDADKRATLARTLRAHPPAVVNTDDHPAAALYHVRQWLATSRAAHPDSSRPATPRGDFLADLMGLRFEWAIWAAAAATLAMAGIAALRGRAAFARTALLWSVGTTGLAGMALEIVLLYTFQVMYGYVYSMVGLVVGVFMFGLVLGSAAMNRRLRQQRPDAPRPGLRTLVGIDLVFTVFAAGTVLVLAVLRDSAADWFVQAGTFSLVAVTGVLGGLVFPLAAAVTLEEQPGTTRAAGRVAAADYFGACLGAIVTGTLLVPVLGITGTCLVVAMVKTMSALFVGVAAARQPLGAAARA